MGSTTISILPAAYWFSSWRKCNGHINLMHLEHLSKPLIKSNVWHNNNNRGKIKHTESISAGDSSVRSRGSAQTFSKKLDRDCSPFAGCTASLCVPCEVDCVCTPKLSVPGDWEELKKKGRLQQRVISWGHRLLATHQQNVGFKRQKNEMGRPREKVPACVVQISAFKSQKAPPPPPPPFRDRHLPF